MSEIPFDERVANELLRYARMVVARGYVHNSLGNIAIGVPHLGFPHEIAYTKHAEVSLEERPSTTSSSPTSRRRRCSTAPCRRASGTT
jgi:hypothetical protein